MRGHIQLRFNKCSAVLGGIEYSQYCLSLDSLFASTKNSGCSTALHKRDIRCGQSVVSSPSEDQVRCCDQLGRGAQFPGRLTESSCRVLEKEWAYAS